MNDISNVNGLYQLVPIAVRRQTVAEVPCENEHRAPHDQVEISDLGALLSRVRALPDLQLDRIARLQAEIADGTFETPERLNGTVDRLLEVLAE